MKQVKSGMTDLKNKEMKNHGGGGNEYSAKT